METHEVGGQMLGRIERHCQALMAAGSHGSIGIDPEQVVATLSNLELLMSLTPANLEPKVNWDNHEGRARPVHDLLMIMRDEFPAPVTPAMQRKIMQSLENARIRTIGQLAALSIWGLEHEYKLGQVAIRVLEAALALRHLEFARLPVGR